MARALRGDHAPLEPVATLADGVRVKHPGRLTQQLLGRLLDDIVIVREAELRETLVRLALEEHVIAEGAGALALAAGRRVAGRRKCAVVSGGNLDAGVLRSEEHTSELQSLMRTSYAVFCLKKKTKAKS